ncbi:TetR/AcrR family transcriptional regulator [Paenibacillus solisilvae]|uniref:TetR/AcrR family transcriptional regulator n=1 Tax=Paenibacillus solisilvae TaxID=2486751 RepID=A0ABW0W9Z7_9BACL
MLQRTERKDAAKHRELILQTAAQLFNKQGVDSVSMHQIAKTAGIGQGTLYRRYSCKAELCIELLMDSFEKFVKANDQYLSAAAERPVHERFKTFLSKWIDYIADKVQWLNAIKPSSLCSDDHLRIYRSPPFTYVTGVIKQLLDEGIQTETIVPVNTSFAAFNVASSLSPESFLFLYSDQKLTPEQIKEHFINFYWKLLFRNP